MDLDNSFPSSMENRISKQIVLDSGLKNVISIDDKSFEKKNESKFYKYSLI